jgi:type II secretory pathway component PulL
VSNGPVGSPAGAGVLVPVLSGAVLALVVGSLFFYYQLNQLRHDLDQLRAESSRVRGELALTRSQLLAEIAKEYEASTASTQANKSTADVLKSELQAARQQARTLRIWLPGSKLCNRIKLRN